MLHNKSIEPKVSIILPTCNRPFLLDIALAHYHAQNYKNKELIIIDDSDSKIQNRFKGDIKYIHLQNKTSLGEKMNIGIECSIGDFILKMDDDDFYGQNFVSRMILEYPKHDNCIAFHQPFVFFDLKNWELRLSDEKRCSGATFFFKKEIWQIIKFRNVPEAVDAYFLIDFYNKIEKKTIHRIFEPTSFLQIRHQNHTWNTMPNGELVTDYLKNCEIYDLNLSSFIPKNILNKYKFLNNSLNAK